MKKRLKAFLPIGISVLFIASVSIGVYWLGYYMGLHSILPPINQDTSIYDAGYISNKQLGTKDGGMSNYNYCYQKGRQEQI